MKITVLCDNLTTSGCLAEHGYAALIVADGKRILLDTGASDVVTENAQRLGVRLDKLDAIVLSHGHRDHCGGLPAVLGVSGPTRIVAHPDVFADRIRKSNGKWVSMGLAFTPEYIESIGGQWVLTDKPYRFTPNVFTTGPIRRVTDFEAPPAIFKIRRDGKIINDPFADDLTVCVKTRRGIVAVTGCAHAGLVNILRHVERQARGQRIAAVFGGAHLNAVPDARIVNTVEELNRLDVRKVALTHCTGVKVMARLDRELPGRFDYVNAGDTRTL